MASIHNTIMTHSSAVADLRSYIDAGEVEFSPRAERISYDIEADFACRFDRKTGKEAWRAYVKGYTAGQVFAAREAELERLYRIGKIGTPAPTDNDFGWSAHLDRLADPR